MTDKRPEIEIGPTSPAEQFAASADARTLVLPAPVARRAVAVAVLCALGLIHLWIVITTPPAAIIGSLFLYAVGFGALYMAFRIWTATKSRLLLTDEDIREETGRVLCRVEDIERIERGAFAFKPSNGFVVVLKEKAPRGWAPGLWWRIGRRVGVGGVTSAGAGKAMADVVAARVAGVGRLD